MLGTYTFVPSAANPKLVMLAAKTGPVPAATAAAITAPARSLLRVCFIGLFPFIQLMLRFELTAPKPRCEAPAHWCFVLRVVMSFSLDDGSPFHSYSRWQTPLQTSLAAVRRDLRCTCSREFQRPKR